MLEAWHHGMELPGTFHGIELPRFLLADEKDLAHVTFAEEFNLDKAGWTYFDLVLQREPLERSKSNGHTPLAL